ncbi:MBL fold metallo-hydrolase [Pseudooceanicola sediminis]|uniref:MBL fold metallo-hydrolase n=1 Tax=Pseudooceanicola sediminis TaxID=2211117 RepID=A0A399IY29_9RHOB|nr:MBL fold metallo-hydrolase [Pseudooceanicola sediminis]RII37884.1 MBL fold metallo-hydrolase [Pseudooceanicola sediminis]|tara:strand:- start:38224 stop:39123 length:900 start_codon:yes stop_codon:yes gene_type:complete
MVALGPHASVERVIDIDPFRLPLDFLFPDAQLGTLATARGWLAPHHVDFDRAEVLLGVQSHLLRIGGRVILIDSCVGEHKHRPNRADWHMRADTGYLARLAAHGVTPADVDVVFCTHLHADHVGWNTRLEDGRWVPTFPNARYLVGRTELAHWQTHAAANHGAFTDSVAPLLEAGCVDVVDDGADLGGKMQLAPARLDATDLSGHSPGQLGLVVQGGGTRAIFCGDAIHNPAQLVRPDWTSQFCHDRALAARTRRQLLQDASDTGSYIIPAHLRHAMAFRPLPRHDNGHDTWQPLWLQD